MRNRLALALLVSLATVLVLTPEAGATATYTATGTVLSGTGGPVSGRAVSVRRVWVNGGATQSVTTNVQGVFTVSWTAASSVYFYVTVTVEGGTNSVTGTASRQLNWCCGGTKNFGVWTILGGTPGPPGDVDRDGISDTEEERLLQKFAPQVRLHPDDWTKPASVDWLLPLTHMNYSHLGNFLFFSCPDHTILAHGTPTYGTNTSTDITAQQHQSATDWPGCNDFGPYHRSDSFSPDSHEGFYLQQYDGSHGGSSTQHDWKVYGHVYPGSSNRVVVQYWFFYPYNDGYLTFNHEGDWEHILLVVEPQNGDAVVDVWYSQHDSPRRYTWDQLTKVNGHPVVYAAKGSHADYAFYVTFLGEQVCENPAKRAGHIIDYCKDGGTVWNTWDAQAFGGVVNVGESQFTMSADWLRYSGRWGELGVFDFTSGPKGPAYQPNYWRYCGSPELCNNGIDDDVDGIVDEAQCTTLPDLTVDELNPIMFDGGFPGPELVAPGDSIRVTGAIANEGSTTASAFTTRVALSSDELYDDTDPQLLSVTLPGLTQHTESALDVNTTYQVPPLADGIYHLVAKADSGGAVTEGLDGETNNTAASEFLVEVDSKALRLENFDDGVANGFSPAHGTWDASGGAYLATGTGLDDNATVSLVPSPEGSVTMEFDFWVTDAGAGTIDQPYFGAILRYQDASHFLRVDTFRLSTGTSYVRLLSWNSTYQVLASTPLPAAVDKGLHHLSIDDRGCQITVFLDGQSYLSSAYAGTIPLGSRGLFVNRGTQVAFDNFRIKRLEDADQDGWNAACGDCNDQNSNVNPGRTENCCTNYDDNCNGVVNEGCGGGGCGGGCFPAGTAIAMADGTTRPIESLRAGDLVLSYDQAAKSIVSSPVVLTFRHDAPEKLVVVDGSLRATPNHELFTNGEWLPLDGLMKKDALTRLIRPTDSAGMTTRQEPVRTIETVPGDGAIYDIEVAVQHNYFANGVLVHNKVQPTGGAPPN
jgi:hypothetical protein